MLNGPSVWQPLSNTKSVHISLMDAGCMAGLRNVECGERLSSAFGFIKIAPCGMIKVFELN